MKRSDLELSTSRSRCLSVRGLAQRRRDAWMLFTKCVCVNPTSASQGFFEPLRDSEEKKQYTLSAIAWCRLSRRCGHFAHLPSLLIHQPQRRFRLFQRLFLSLPDTHFCFILYFTCSFLCLTNLPFSLSLLLNFFHFAFYIVPFALFLFFHSLSSCYPSLASFLLQSFPLHSLFYYLFVFHPSFLSIFLSHPILIARFLAPLFLSSLAAVVFFSFPSFTPSFLRLCFPFPFFFLHVSFFRPLSLYFSLGLHFFRSFPLSSTLASFPLLHSFFPRLSK